MTAWEGAVHKQEKRCQKVKFHVLKAGAVTFIDPIRSHTQRRLLSVWLHPALLISTETGALNSQRTPDLAHFYLTVSHCSHQSRVPLWWRLSLCGGDQSQVSGSSPWLSLRPNRGGGVFTAQSGLCSQSSAAPDSLSLPLSLSSLNYNHPSYICNYSDLPLFRGPGGFSPFHLAHYYAPASPALMKLFKVVLLLLKHWIAVNCFQLF